MSDRIPVLINRTGGTAAKLGDKLGEDVEAAFAEAGPKWFSTPPDSIERPVG